MPINPVLTDRWGSQRDNFTVSVSLLHCAWTVPTDIMHISSTAIQYFVVFIVCILINQLIINART